MNPLNLVIDDPEIRQMRVETDLLAPMSINDNAVNGQPTCRFVLKNRGFLHSDSRLIIPAKVSNAVYQYAPTGGVFSLIKRATMRIGAQVIQQVEDVNLLMSQMNLLHPIEHRELVDRPLHGVLSSFESCSGSNGQKDNEPEDAQKLIGQHRIKGDYPTKIERCREPKGLVYYTNSKQHPAYELQTSTIHSSTQMGTPEFMISLSQIFVGFQGQNLEIPCSLISPDQSIEIEIEFSPDGVWGTNERVILDGSHEVEGSLGENVEGAATTISDAGTNYVVGDVLSVTDSAGGGRNGVVEVVSVGGGGAVTAYKVISAGSGYNNLADATTAHLKVANLGAADFKLNLSAVGARTAQYDLSLYDHVVENNPQKCTIDTKNVRLAVDYIFYEDGTEERVANEMMGESGLVMPYTQFRTIKSTINANQDLAGQGGGNFVDIADGSSNTIEVTRQIGLSNEIVRQVTIQQYPVGKNPTISKNSGLSATHPLLLNYCSMDSMVEDKGKTFQLTINSVPYNPSPVDHSQHGYQLHSECFSAPLYCPLSAYTGWCSAKQQDTQALTANSKQPGFSTLTSIDTATARYRLNVRKCGMANSKVRGLKCNTMNGMLSYKGQSFKLGMGNQSGNGIRVGSVPVVLDMTFKATKDDDTSEPFHSRNQELVVFAECERLFQLKNGYVSVSGASF